MIMENTRIADMFDEIADLLDLQEKNPFRIRSYRSAAQTVRGLSEPLETKADNLQALTDIPNIGKSTAEKIQEIVQTGTCTRLEQLRDEMPKELTHLMDIPQLGPRKVALIYKTLGIESIEGLKQACEDGKVRELEGMGEKTEENILKGIQTLESTAGRIALKAAVEQMDELGEHLDSISAIKRWEVAGSFRRGRETVGDLDILVHATDRSKAADRISEYAEIKDIASKGTEKVTAYLESGLQIDFRFFDPTSFGAALLYFTGSKAHNITLRKRAQKSNWKLNEYGLLEDDKRLAGQTEEEVFKKLNLPWIPPELREDRGEIEAAEKDDLPTLIDRDDLQGDLHCHSNETDGDKTITEMAEAARQRGYSYIAITDHSKAVSVANGLDEERLKKHADTIREASDAMDGFWILAGIEVDILKDGHLDLKEDVLDELDWVIASIHSYFTLSSEDMTERLLKAIGSGVVDCIGHPLGRMIGRRDPIQFDADKIYEACVANNVCLEINSQPDRMDLPDNYCKTARDAGITFAVSTDAHNDADLDLVRYGLAMARRGWLEKKHVINTYAASTLRKKLRQHE